MKTWWGTSYFITCYFIFALLVAVESAWAIIGKKAIKQLFRMATALPFSVLLYYTFVYQCHYPVWDPSTFPYPNFTNGTSREEEWRQTLAFPFWLQCLVSVSPLPLVVVGVFTVWDVGQHIHTGPQDRQTGPQDGQREMILSLRRRHPVSTWLIKWTGSETADHIFFLRITPFVFALLSYSSILRLMQLFTGEYIIDDPKYANQPLWELLQFFGYLINGNSNCSTFASAIALLHFSAYLLEDFRNVAPNMHELISGVVVQMLKYYLGVSVLQMSSLIFFFFVFRYEHNSEEHGIPHQWAIRMINEFHHYHPAVIVALGSAGSLASMSAWGALNLITPLCRHQEHITLPLIKLKCPAEFGVRFHKKFFSIKFMLSVSFLQQIVVFIVGSVMGYPSATTALAAECLNVYEAPLLAWIVWKAWAPTRANQEALLA